MAQTILIVDDDSLMLKMTGHNLKYLCPECHIIVANSGVECLDILKKEENKVDVILLDYQMPQMDGVYTLKYIRENLNMSKLQVIIYTSEPIETIREALLGIYPNELDNLKYLKKPAKLEEYMAFINQRGKIIE